MIKFIFTSINLKLKLLLMIIICYYSIINSTSIAKISSNFNYYKKHEINQNIIRIYNPDTRILTYKISAESTNYFQNKKTILFKKTQSIMFDKNHLPIWLIKAQNAFLTKEQILFLSGNVQIHNLIKTHLIKKITTNQSTINLITHDIFSNNKTIIYGNNFNSIGMNMQSNLNNQTIKLFNHITTTYEI